MCQEVLGQCGRASKLAWYSVVKDIGGLCHPGGPCDVGASFWGGGRVYGNASICYAPSSLGLEDKQVTYQAPSLILTEDSPVNWSLSLFPP